MGAHSSYQLALRHVVARWSLCTRQHVWIAIKALEGNGKKEGEGGLCFMAAGKQSLLLVTLKYLQSGNSNSPVPIQYFLRNPWGKSTCLRGRQGTPACGFG